MPKHHGRARGAGNQNPRRLLTTLGTSTLGTWTRQARRHAQRLNIPLPAALGGIAGYALAHTTSLLPRTPLFQGVVAAVNASVGYELGMMAADVAALRRAPKATPGVNPAPTTVSPIVPNPLTGVPTPRPGNGSLRSGLAAAALGATLIGVPLAALRSQRRTAEFCQVPGPRVRWAPASAAASVAILGFFTLCWRITEMLLDWLSHHLGQRLAWRLAARALATLVVLAGTAVLFDQVILRGIRLAGRTVADRLDHSTPAGVTQPDRAVRSGSPSSGETWDSLGLQGKRFVSGGPDAARIARVLGSPAQDPVRVYAALDGRGLAGIARAVLDEMDRTNAWQRRVISIVTTTGRGNANEWSASALEYLLAGDCCTIATQYSGLPSAITLFTSREQPVAATRVLFEAVQGRLAAMPANERPQLFLAGESLGAYGSNGIFTDVDDMVAHIDGALWLGTPNFTPMHRELTRSRDAGSSAVAPVVDRGRHIRFAGRSAQLSADEAGRPLDAWQSPRIAYLQNETDPVVWWGTRLLYRRPEWLAERRPATTPMGRMHWFPFVTFWQVCADMPVCRNVPEGFGHKYHASQITPAWAGVLGRDPRADYSAIEQGLIEDVTIPPIKVFGI